MLIYTIKFTSKNQIFNVYSNNLPNILTSNKDKSSKIENSANASEKSRPPEMIKSKIKDFNSLETASELRDNNEIKRLPDARSK